MTPQFYRFAIDWNDPQLREKALQYFLTIYRAKQKAQQEKSNDPEKPAGETREALVIKFELGVDNLPEEYLSNEHFQRLINLNTCIDALLRMPLPDVKDDGCAAAFLLITGLILSQARLFIRAILVFLMCDKRFHVGQRIQIDATSALGFGEKKKQEAAFRENAETLLTSLKLYDIIRQSDSSTGDLSNALQILRECGEIYFTTLSSIFPICAIGKCHRAFNLYVDKIGTAALEERVRNYVRRRKTMQCEIKKYMENNNGRNQVMSEPIKQALEELSVNLKQTQSQIGTMRADMANHDKRTTDALKRVDQRQRRLYDFIKRILKGFVQLFAPLVPRPTFSQVKDTFTPSDRFACLESIKEPHRSQIMAVIKYTKDHPIVRKQQNRDQFSLSNAVRAVWNLNHEKWSRIPGSFESFDQLKAACYNLQQKENDPFYYQT